jgi:cleavage and polyadenylation specificity factor subunit 1
MWCKECQLCQRAKASNQAAAAEQPIAVPLCRFSHVHVDLVGPLPVSSEGFVYLLTVIDRSTRWAEAVPLKSATAGDCADGLISGWMSRFGVPSMLTSDRGVQFSSALWAALMKKLGIKHKLCSAFHPQRNGLIERFHGRLKEALKARAAAADWPSHIPWVLFGLRAALRDESGVSAAELLYGSPLTLPGQFLPTAERTVADRVSSAAAAGHAVLLAAAGTRAARGRHHTGGNASGRVRVRENTAGGALIVAGLQRSLQSGEKIR